jgi:hypothetical protein
VDGSEPGHRSQISTRGPRGRFLALEPAQAGFRQLEIAVTHVFVAVFSGSLRVSPNVRMNRVMRPKMELIGPDSMPLGILAQASWRANRRAIIVVLGRVSFRDGPFVRLVQHVSKKIDRVKRLPWRDAHMVVLPLLTPN